jgi:hypothetical protein
MILRVIGWVVVVPISPGYSVAKRLAAAAAVLAAGTLLFYLIPALPDAPARGDAGHFWRALGNAAIVELVMLLVIRFVIKPELTEDSAQ